MKRTVFYPLVSKASREEVKSWLKEHGFYVSVNGSESTVRVTWYGIVQGSILGPTLYAIFISPLFEVENLTCFADDNFLTIAVRGCKFYLKS